ncbi:MAG: hypothetical protein M3005_02140 [Apilactobacillus sp.]|uniref:hypothetical protein n=1 Tax=Apilactobacillus TaxID=2767877 RepID=UPI0025FEADB0|nr:hypothetical protein [Apilactobacillus sp.]MCT6822650.1 hypothetical protein [Apilactobacillus sp.]MCT6858424.1 hypothetical protein [Apilactobacillus sp.]
MNYSKYLDDLTYESPDTVLGSIMSQAGFPELDDIKDACDILYLTDDPDDHEIINQHQPMFYNVKEHRLVNKQDIIDIIAQLEKTKK